MKAQPNPSPSKPQPAPPPPARPVVWIVAATLLLAGIAGAIWKLSQPAAPDLASDQRATAAGQRESNTLHRLRPEGTAGGSTTETVPVDPAPPAAAPDSSPLPPVVKPPEPPVAPVDPVMGSLASGLIQLRGTNALTPETVANWKANLLKLAQGGAAAVPAIQAFLKQHEDLVFDADTARAFGYRTARLAAFDALRQIGGPEAVALMDQTFSETQSPREIAALAWNLNGMTDGQYRDKAISVAREALAKAGNTPEVDVAPLFEVFQKYGDAAMVPQLESATGRWKYYAVSALANLPEGAGVPSLVRMADPAGNGANRLAALQMLAQVAVNHPAARESLLTQIGGNQIPPNFWAYLNAPLAGEELYPVDAILTKYPPVNSWSDIKSTRINYGNQTYYTLPGETVQTADGINQRLALIDQFLSVAGDPAAKQTLQQAKDALNRRLAQVPVK